MRILKPEIAEERKRHLLQWVIHHYMGSSAPVSSKMIAEEGSFKLSPATIRSVLKELEQEGYLHQEHASAGRVPTDKGYRLYVDYLVEMQRLAVKEKHAIESEYRRRISELDKVLAQTSRMLSSMSHSAGFALSPKLEESPVQRLELVPLGTRHILLVLLTQSGMIRHMTVETGVPIAPARLTLLSQFLNESLQGRSLPEIRDALAGEIQAAEREFRDLQAVARDVLGQVSQVGAAEELYLDGAASLAALPGSDPDELRSLLGVVEDRRRLAHILEEEFEEQLRRHAGPSPDRRAVTVRIGAENLPELRNLSLVTTTYEARGQLIGLLGILGSKHMEYPKMMALVRFVGTVVSETLSRWEDIYGDVREEANGK